MIKFHERNDGDIVKILPFIKDDKIKWCESFDVISLSISDVVFDNTGLLSRIINLHNYRNPSDKVMIVKKHFFHSYSNGDSKILSVGRKLYETISGSKLDVRNNQHLLIRSKMISGFPSFDGSTIIEHNWIPPVSDINSEIEWLEWLKDNQPDIKEYIGLRSIEKNRSKMIQKFGTDLVSELIQKERNEKLEKILI